MDNQLPDKFDSTLTRTGLSSKEDSEDSGDGWDEIEVSDSQQTTCLFCPLQFHTIAVALDHCRSAHNFDLLKLKTKYGMDCYSYIKMINYIRLQKPDPKAFSELDCPLWNDDCYLKPVDVEPWLMYDFEDLGSAPSTPHYAIEGEAPINNVTIDQLQAHIYNLDLKLKQKDTLLESYVSDLKKMKQVLRSVVENPGSSAEALRSPTACDLPGNENSDYFGSYSHFGIHHEMLNDRIRTESYRDAILKNCDSFKDKIVLDLGCGTAILSMFSAKAGAQKVYGIDQSDVVYKAMDIVRENKLENIIHLIKGQLEKTNLPVEKVDIIVSEWMGYFLLFEGMLDSFIYARNTYLTPGGLILPNRCTISLCGVGDVERYSSLINFWDDVYGFSMKCMKPEVLQEAVVEVVPQDKILTDAVEVSNLDLMTCTTNACNFRTKFKLRVLKSGTLTAVAGYFDTFFELPDKVEFSTGPHVPKTHWQQTVFYLKKVIEVQSGESVEGVIVCSKLKKNVRGLSVTLTIKDETYDYIID